MLLPDKQISNRSLHITRICLPADYKLMTAARSMHRTLSPGFRNRRCALQLRRVRVELGRERWSAAGAELRFGCAHEKRRPQGRLLMIETRYQA